MIIQIFAIFGCFLSVKKCSTCVYWLADKAGVDESRLLDKIGINLTIVGERSYHSETPSIECFSINGNMFKNMKNWVSLSTTYSSLDDCCQLQIYECLNHHLPEEKGHDFIERVLSTCSVFRGKVSHVICRNSPSNYTNIINRIKMVSESTDVNEISTIGCSLKENEPFISPQGVPLLRSSNDIISVDVEKGTIFNIGIDIQPNQKVKLI